MPPTTKKQPEPSDETAQPDSAKTGDPSAYERGYAAGYAAAAKAQRPSLFDAAKLVCREMFDLHDEVIDERLVALEKEYDDEISNSDRRLLQGIVRRHRVAAEAQRQAVMNRPRPKSDVGLTVSRKLGDQPAETAYEVVR